MTEPIPAPLPETVWPPAPSHDAREPLSFRAEAIELTKSGGRLMIVNHFMRWVFVLSISIQPLSLLSPFYSYWTSRFHHATWKGMLPAVLVTYQQMYWLYLLVLFVAALLCWVYIAGGNVSGIVLNQRNGTAKAGGRTRPLESLESVGIIVRGQPDIFRRRYTVQLEWNDNQALPKWRRALFSLGPKTSFVGLFRQEANAEKFVRAITEFAGLSAEHQTIPKNSV